MNTVDDIFNESQDQFGKDQIDAEGLLNERVGEGVRLHFVPDGYPGPFLREERVSQQLPNGVWVECIQRNFYLSATTGNPVYPDLINMWQAYDLQLITDIQHRGICTSRFHLWRNHNFMISDAEMADRPVYCPDCARKHFSLQIAIFVIVGLCGLGTISGVLAGLGFYSE